MIVPTQKLLGRDSPTRNGHASVGTERGREKRGTSFCEISGSQLSGKENQVMCPEEAEKTVAQIPPKFTKMECSNIQIKTSIPSGDFPTCIFLSILEPLFLFFPYPSFLSLHHTRALGFKSS